MRKIKDFIPPILVQLLRPTRTMKVYDSYDDALADSESYDDPGIIEVVSRKTATYRNALLARTDKTIDNSQSVQNMFVLLRAFHGRPLEVLEIGGACGASYFELNHLLPGMIKSWRVLERPAMAGVGMTLRDETLDFYDDLHKATSLFENRDLLVAQGVFQYTPDPLMALESWLKLGFKYVYITRTVVVADTDCHLITKQISNLSEHGPGASPEGFVDKKTSQPLTLVPLHYILAKISVDHSVLYSFVESDRGSMSMVTNRSVLTKTVGFLLERKIR